MGTKLVSFFEDAQKLGGVKAKVKFAMLTKLSQQAATDAPDAPETIAAFQAAMDTIKKEFG